MFVCVGPSATNDTEQEDRRQDFKDRKDPSRDTRTNCGPRFSVG